MTIVVPGSKFIVTQNPDEASQTAQRASVPVHYH